ncbi:hypothetical protein MBM_08194 [Drepanopeziza brunnea f. sp. 'multigermtubi' MB_m1]|uniref:Uncharacterized protein n=1 Tax=Marssonina brunnea f. sp. multigermtubi (strain MB_m1) TaxID=1072389 RepID=K1WKT6_MARBU|nr:uncharacterized protein MBM_08194 [Drepanopeziza brunnea f. sp. 'multigermtubi' MB_m1]EKD13476.1 hypothetical protein MBM_08194 [Drepanopeziza brunnea f. sp. 'multigermtubi' MB_m1]
MSLLAFSNELICEILRHLDSPLTAIARFSRRLHLVTEPFIYSKIFLNHRDPYNLFIRTVLGNKGAIKHVRHFHTYGKSTPGTYFYLLRGAGISLKLEIPRESCYPKETCRTEFSSAHPFGWDYDLSFLTDAYRVLVRGQLPDTVYGKGLFDQWFGSMFFPPNVNWLQIHIYWDAITAFLFTLFAAPLKSIGLMDYGWMVNKYPIINLALGNTDGQNHRITDLTLTQGFLRGLSPVKFLQSFRALKRFQYQHKTITFPVSKIGRGLFDSRHSLEELHVYQWTHPRYSLDFTDEEEPSADEDEGDSDSKANLIGSLQMLTKQKSVVVVVVVVVVIVSNDSSSSAETDPSQCRGSLVLVFVFVFVFVPDSAMGRDGSAEGFGEEVFWGGDHVEGGRSSRAARPGTT